MDEFGIIKKYFEPLGKPRKDITLGIGDDAALLQMLPGQELVVTTDTLTVDHHFFHDGDPYSIGWKSLAVSLSDLAAMGAMPQWCTMALTLPNADEEWLAEFARGFKDLADVNHIVLVGGNLSHGPMSITVTAIGSVIAGTAMKRRGARAGDLVCVTGTLGDAALGLRMAMLLRRAEAKAGRKLWRRSSDADDPIEPGFALNTEPSALEALYLRGRLDKPDPRVKAGLILRQAATAGIDLSDGLAGDLQHILTASGVGAEIYADRLPTSEAFAKIAPPAFRFQLQLAGGDDYELCVTLPADVAAEMRRKLDVPLTIVGRITGVTGLRYLNASGAVIPAKLRGFQHFT
ncbi:MAG TPA: thiamine-phosphate kinase [Nevskiaceae bacterium]|nr:thiamine-phosphate kinase [Nevskiaceae bacterium]